MKEVEILIKTSLLWFIGAEQTLLTVVYLFANFSFLVRKIQIRVVTISRMKSKKVNKLQYAQSNKKNFVITFNILRKIDNDTS